MKVVSFIFILLFLEARASFFDDFRGAISNISSGFGKLISDVFVDVKDTICCTISAVEQVMVQNGLLDKRTLYNRKCKGVEKPKNQTLNFGDGSHSRTVSKIRKHSVIHHKHSSRRYSHESVEKVNKTIIDVLGNSMDLKNVTDTFEDETNSLSKIRKMIRQESENISKQLKTDIKQLQNDNKKSPVASVWEDIKFLNDLRRNSKNDTEANEIRRILDKVIDEMHLKINTQQILDDHGLDELKKELQKFSSNNQGNNGKLNSTTKNQDVLLNKDNENVNRKAQSQEKSIFSLGMDALSSLFNSKPVSAKDLKKANNIITDSENDEKVINKFFKG